MAKSSNWPICGETCPLLKQAPVPMMVLDQGSQVLETNEAFWQFIGVPNPESCSMSVEDALPPEMVRVIQDAIQRVSQSGEPLLLESVRLDHKDVRRRVLDLQVAPAELHGQPAIIITSTRVPDSGRRVAELTLLHDMTRVLRQQSDLEHVLFTTLTCATAGYGIAFNRAFVLLVNHTSGQLDGRMAIGPSSEQEAHRIWADLSGQPQTLEDFVAAYDDWRQADSNPLQDAVLQMHFSMDDDAERMPVLATTLSRTIHIRDAANDERVGDDLREMLQVNEFVVAPMFVANEPIGVIIADNRFSGREITHSDLRMLSLFAQHAGMAIESAQGYARLEEAQDELVRAETLGAIGDMAARVAHDVRNPVVTIGGWAQDLCENPNDPEAVLKAAKIISQEAIDLEQILSQLVGPLATRATRPQPGDINRLLGDTFLARRHALADLGVELHMHLVEHLPTIHFDSPQVRRAVINLIDNATAAMPNGGQLNVRSGYDDDHVWFSIEDTGIGMNPETAEHIFDPFFTTRHYGSGLGLAIVWDTLSSHGWTVEVSTEPEHGTTFTVKAPLPNTTAPAVVSEVAEGEQ